MLRTALLIPNPSTAGVLVRWGDWLRRTWERSARDDDECFLCEARDLADLEGRLQRLERGRPDRFAPLPPGL